MVVTTKRAKEKAAYFAKGGSTRAFGTGDRTRTAPGDAAGQQAAGRTGHKTSTKGSLLAAGGKRMTGGASVSLPAKAGHTAPPRKGR